MFREHVIAKDGRVIAYGYENIIGPDFFVQVYRTESDPPPSEGDPDWKEEMIHNFSTLAYMGEEKKSKKEIYQYLYEHVDFSLMDDEFMFRLAN